jgi:hypothetical protein
LDQAGNVLSIVMAITAILVLVFGGGFTAPLLLAVAAPFVGLSPAALDDYFTVTVYGMLKEMIYSAVYPSGAMTPDGLDCLRAHIDAEPAGLPWTFIKFLFDHATVESLNAGANVRIFGGADCTGLSSQLCAPLIPGIHYEVIPGSQVSGWYTQWSTWQGPGTNYDTKTWITNQIAGYQLIGMVDVHVLSFVAGGNYMSSGSNRTGGNITYICSNDNGCGNASGRKRSGIKGEFLDFNNDYYAQFTQNAYEYGLAQLGYTLDTAPNSGSNEYGKNSQSQLDGLLSVQRNCHEQGSEGQLDALYVGIYLHPELG